jgi:type VI secretion system protein VasL
MELKHAGQLDALSILLHNAAVRLESSENKEETAPQAPAPEPAPSSLPEPTAQVKWVYVAEPASRPNADVVTAFPAPAKPWRPFVAGMLTMLALAGAAAGGWRATHPSDSGQMRFPARLSTLPTVLSAEQLQMLRQQSPRPRRG